MGTVKIEFDLPEFKKELNINIVIKKDGEVVYTASSPMTSVNETTRDNQSRSSFPSGIGEDLPKSYNTTSNPERKKIRGNLMGESM